MAIQIRREGAAFMLFLGALGALPPLATDMALPALTAIGDGLHTAPSMAGLTLSLFMAGFAASPVVYGPLADRFGRRPVLLIGLALFTLAGIVAATAPSITTLLTARLVQGAGAGAGMALAFAIIRDLFDGAAARTRLAVITMVANLAPIVAPALGAGLLAPIGWRGLYAIMAGSGLVLALVTWLGFAETRPARAAAPTGLVRSYRRVLGNQAVRSHILINALGFGWMFAYVAGSPLVLLGVLHLSPALYAAMFACTGAGIVGGAALNGELSRHGVPGGTLLRVAVAVAVAVTLALVAVTALGQPTLPVLMPLLVMATGCFGLAAPSATHAALDPLPQFAGLAGGLLTSVQMLFGALASSAVALLFPWAGMLAMTATMAACAVLALVILLLQPAPRRRRIAHQSV